MTQNEFMTNYIEKILKPFATEVHKVIQKIIPKVEFVEYHYAYGPAANERHWFTDFNLIHLDKLIAISKKADIQVDTSNIDIRIKFNSSKNDNVQIRFDHTLLSNEGGFFLEAKSNIGDSKFVVDSNLIEEKGFEELAKEFVKKEMEEFLKVQ